MKNKYKVSTRNGQPAIFTDRGLICLMEAGNQSTREKDAADIVAILNAAPDLLDALEDAAFLMRMAAKIAGPMQDSFKRSAEDAAKALAKAEGEE